MEYPSVPRENSRNSVQQWFFDMRIEHFPMKINLKINSNFSYYVEAFQV